MSTRMDISTPRPKKGGGTYWVKIGTAWISDTGSTQLVFDALPLPDKEGRVVANLFEPRERDATPQQRSKPATAFETDLSDDVPF